MDTLFDQQCVSYLANIRDQSTTTLNGAELHTLQLWYSAMVEQTVNSNPHIITISYSGLSDGKK